MRKMGSWGGTTLEAGDEVQGPEDQGLSHGRGGGIERKVGCRSNAAQIRWGCLDDKLVLEEKGTGVASQGSSL